ncbi:MAG: hypothetical protein SV253_09705 [Halobacteria archaeon]|nr:hypothetical protein [Halobacteria archaeon]
MGTQTQTQTQKQTDDTKPDPGPETTSETRDVVVTERAYKAATVFTTLASVSMIFAGFYLIDRSIGWPARGDPNVVTGIGVLLILGAAGLYVFSMRFKTIEEIKNGR